MCECSIKQVLDFSFSPVHVPLQSLCDSFSQCCMLADMLCTPWWLICFLLVVRLRDNIQELPLEAPLLPGDCGSLPTQ